MAFLQASKSPAINVLFRPLFRQYGNVGSSKLATLRKKTGFPIGKCKEALSQSQEDVDQAEKWLYERAQAEGWSKVDKLKDRTASQGLIGLMMKGSKAAMLEVNCETDFVAKNDKFHQLVSTAIQAIFDRHLVSPSDETILSHLALSKEDIDKVESTSSKTLADATAEAVGFLGEKLVLQRACVWFASQGTICGHVYNDHSLDSDLLRVGKYAAMVHLRSFTEVSEFGLEDLGKSLCQQVIAMNPKVVRPGEDGVEDPAQILTKQEFVLDESVNVGDMIASHGVGVTKFVRYGVGEVMQS